MEKKSQLEKIWSKNSRASHREINEVNMPCGKCNKNLQNCTCDPAGNYIADVRNKLSPMLTILELIKEENIKPSNEKLTDLWKGCVEQARRSIDYIRELKIDETQRDN